MSLTTAFAAEPAASKSEPAPAWSRKADSARPAKPKPAPKFAAASERERHDWKALISSPITHAHDEEAPGEDAARRQSPVQQIGFEEGTQSGKPAESAPQLIDSKAAEAKLAPSAASAAPLLVPRPIEPTVIETPDPTVIENPIIQEAILERMSQVPPTPENEPAEGTELVPAPTEQPAQQPYELGRISDILPYNDYEPDPQVARDDPCLNLCPRPDKSCPPIADGRGTNLCPPTVQLSDAPFEGRLFSGSVFCWQASNLWSNPLYFEDPALERYGHTHCCVVQPFVSAGRFSAQFLALPYQMSIDPMCSCRYPLGYYRPGECAPKLCYQPPWNFDAALATAGFYTGMTYLIP